MGEGGRRGRWLRERERKVGVGVRGEGLLVCWGERGEKGEEGEDKGRERHSDKLGAS